MIPPTPTPIFADPSVLPQLEIPSLWVLAPQAVQTWNQFGAVTTCIQGGIIVMIVGFTVWMIYKFARRLMNDGERVDG